MNKDRDAPDYEKVCFVSMPYGKKPIFSNGPTIDFDRIYDEVFKPGIESVRLAEGGRLVACRADKEYSTGLLSARMYRYLEYSRFVLADISGHNPNVLMELGVRFRARPHGTAIFSQPEIEIPHNLRPVPCFVYRFHPRKQITSSRKLIAKVLTESLAHATMDSPVHQAFRDWESRPPWFHRKMVAYYNALRSGNSDQAKKALSEALARAPEDGMLRFRLGLLYKDAGMWDLAIGEMDRALAALPAYPEALREKGLTELLCFEAAGRPRGMTTGEESLRAAVKADPRDYLGLMGLGDVLSQSGKIEPSIKAYSRAMKLAPDNRDLMLKTIVLRSALAGKLVTRPFAKRLRAHQSILEKQVASDDRISVRLDLAQIHLYQGNSEAFIELLRQGKREAGDKVELGGPVRNLQMLERGGVDLPGLGKALRALGKSAKGKSPKSGPGTTVGLGRIGGGGFRGGRGGGTGSGF